MKKSDSQFGYEMVLERKRSQYNPPKKLSELSEGKAAEHSPQEQNPTRLTRAHARIWQRPRRQTDPAANPSTLTPG